MDPILFDAVLIIFFVLFVRFVASIIRAFRVHYSLQYSMINLKEINRIVSKSLAWNSKPNEETFPELPEVLVRKD